MELSAHLSVITSGHDGPEQLGKALACLGNLTLEANDPPGREATSIGQVRIHQDSPNPSLLYQGLYLIDPKEILKRFKRRFVN